jgi:hypothetical protein
VRESNGPKERDQVKAIRNLDHRRQLVCEPVRPDTVWSGKHRKAIGLMGPEVGIDGELIKVFDQRCYSRLG